VGHPTGEKRNEVQKDATMAFAVLGGGPDDNPPGKTDAIM